MKLPLIVATTLALGACSLVTPDVTPDEARANAEKRATLHMAMPPSNACAKVARMLSWCARGPNFHYRCTTSLNGSKSELDGVLEAVFRTETFLVVDFTRKGNDTEATLYQRDGVLIYDYQPLIEGYLAGTLDCRPP